LLSSILRLLLREIRMTTLTSAVSFSSSGRNRVAEARWSAVKRRRRITKLVARRRSVVG
jgi:hypothetical protein